ncbi:MAG: hypothetical protein GQ574_04045 [Crocinitomix sp.]|nr:hypothetical protein [Crocinitomix sp.]
MKIIFPIILLSQILFFSCQKRDNIQVLSETNISNVGIYSADVFVEGHVFSENSDYESDYEWGFYYGTNADPEIGSKVFSSGIYEEWSDFNITIEGLLDNTTYYVQPFCAGYGKVYTSNEIVSFQTMADKTGDIGPGGGTIFYQDGMGGGMELSNTDYVGNWGCLDHVPTSIDQGTGAANTALILSTCPSTISAPAICNNLVEGGYDDWYLPSYGDLILVYNNLVVNGYWSPSGESYLSSSQAPSDFDYYYSYRMINNSTGYVHKGINCKYFAVRSF